MSRLYIEKKLLPAKKAWKSFSSSFRKKLRKLKKSKAINKTTKSFTTTIGIVLRRSPRYGFNKNTLTRSSSAFRIHHKTHHHHLGPTYAPVYVDDLFMVHQDKEGATIDAGSSKIVADMEKKHLINHPETSKGSEMDIKKVANNVLKWASPLRGVDERAEEFIAKFKREMSLQREF